MAEVLKPDPPRRTVAPQDQEAASPGPQPSDAPIVDPRPAQRAIGLNPRSLDEELAAHPAAASPPEVLVLEPNRYEDAVGGPERPISMTMYVHWTKPDGTEFVAPIGNSDTYERKGYTRGADEDIPDLVAYLADMASRPPRE